MRCVGCRITTSQVQGEVERLGRPEEENSLVPISERSWHGFENKVKGQPKVIITGILEDYQCHNMTLLPALQYLTK